MGYFPDLLRSCVSSIMNVILLFALIRPRYKPAVTISVMTFCFLTEVSISCFFYYSGNYTMLAKVDLLFLLIIAAVGKPFAKDTVMQWLFNATTTINVSGVIVILSYYLSRPFLYPFYANTAIRFVLYVAFIALLRWVIRPLYLKIVEKWYIFFCLSLCILFNIGYVFISSEDIIATLNDNAVSLIFLAALILLVYGSIFYMMFRLSSEYEIREQHLRLQKHDEMMQKELSLYKDFVYTAKQNRHDLRHHNAIIIEYLSNNDMDGAKEYLNQYDTAIDKEALRQYCKNPVANAVLRLCEHRMTAKGVKFYAVTDIPESLPFTAPELGTLLSNILENAQESCAKVNSSKRFITVNADTESGSLRLEVRNSVAGIVELRDGFPVSTKENGGIGTQSIARIVEKYRGMLRFRQEDGTFVTQLVLPMN